MSCFGIGWALKKRKSAVREMGLYNLFEQFVWLILSTNDIEYSTDSQRQSYILLKATVKRGLSRPNVLCTYLLKTLLFWKCELLHESEWLTYTGLAASVLCLLDELLICVANQYLPNYFIPEFGSDDLCRCNSFMKEHCRTPLYGERSNVLLNLASLYHVVAFSDVRKNELLEKAEENFLKAMSVTDTNDAMIKVDYSMFLVHLHRYDGQFDGRVRHNEVVTVVMDVNSNNNMKLYPPSTWIRYATRDQTGERSDCPVHLSTQYRV
ncbi:hypothetical protein LSAT2_019478 [Lamellibrachia satsuma]|nr:hypothetical protein LSAT2_019478 [Lamellibrachia satsuma]